MFHATLWYVIRATKCFISFWLLSLKLIQNSCFQGMFLIVGRGQVLQRVYLPHTDRCYGLHATFVLVIEFEVHLKQLSPRHVCYCWGGGKHGNESIYQIGCIT